MRFNTAGLVDLAHEIGLLAQDLHAPAAAATLAARARRLARRALRRNGPVRWGNLRRTRPLSNNYGFERGLPVDRVYIERFLAANAGDIRGRVLEVADRKYTLTYGRERVTASEIVDVDASNRDATVIADLASPGSLESAQFDCVIATQTLQYLDRPLVGIENLYRALVPGGVALITVPSASRVDPELPETDFWRLTPRGLERLLRQNGPWTELEVRSYGNVLALTAFLMGVSGDELRETELAEDDPNFPLVACARARKPA